MIICHIAAMAKNRTIGKNNQLPWHIPDDLKFFRAKTKGHFLIMGRKTFESLPGSLPNRINIIITRQKDYKAENALVFQDIKEALQYCASHTGADEEVFIGGGEEIFRATMPLVQRIYLTEISEAFEGDTIYPEFPRDKFALTFEEKKLDPMAFSFKTYDVKS